jgi:hypothetical protein
MKRPDKSRRFQFLKTRLAVLDGVSVGKGAAARSGVGWAGVVEEEEKGGQDGDGSTGQQGDLGAEDFWALIDLREQLERDMSAYVQRPEFALRFLVPGRVVRVVEGSLAEEKRREAKLSLSVGSAVEGGKSSEVDWGWGVVLGFERRGQDRDGNQEGEVEDGEVLEQAVEQQPDEASADSIVVYVLLPAVEDVGSAGASKGGGAGVRAGVGGEEGGRKRRADCSDAALELAEEQELLRRLSPYFGGGGRGVHRTCSAVCKATVAGEEGAMLRGDAWRPVILPMLLSCVKGISSVKLLLPGAVAGGEGGGEEGGQGEGVGKSGSAQYGESENEFPVASSDLRANSAHRVEGEGQNSQKYSL